MVDVKVCDLELITDATSAGLTVVSCELDDISGCKENCGTLVPGASCLARCELRVPSRVAWLAFADLDDDDNPDCYSNTMTGEGDIDPSICAPRHDRLRESQLQRPGSAWCRRVSCWSASACSAWTDCFKPESDRRLVRRRHRPHASATRCLCAVRDRSRKRRRQLDSASCVSGTLLTQIPVDISAPTLGTAKLEVVGAGGSAFCGVPAGFNVNDTEFGLGSEHLPRRPCRTAPSIRVTSSTCASARA